MEYAHLLQEQESYPLDRHVALWWDLQLTLGLIQLALQGICAAHLEVVPACGVCVRVCVCVLLRASAHMCVHCNIYCTD